MKFLLKFVILIILVNPSISLSSNDPIKKKLDFEIPLFSTYDYSQLKNEFHYIKRIGRGGESVVFEVESDLTGKHYALVMNCSMRLLVLNSEKPFFEKMIQYQEFNPHQVKIHAALWLKNPNYSFSGTGKVGISPCDYIPQGEFIRNDFLNDSHAQIFYHQILIQELGEGDLADKDFKALNIPTIITNFQVMMNNYRLDQADIVNNDSKYRNHIYKKLDNEKYNGFLLKNYDYWHYTIGNYNLYLPRQEFIVKRIDLGGWRLRTYEGRNYEKVRELLEAFSQNNGLTFDEMIHFFKKPDDINAKILTID